MGVEVNLQRQIDDPASGIDEYVRWIAEEIDRDGNTLTELAQQKASQTIAEVRQQVQQIIEEAVSKAEDESISYMTELKLMERYS